MSRLALEQLNDFADYTDCQELSEILRKSSLSDVRLSPDGRHIHVILRKPQVGLVTFDKYERPNVNDQLAQNQKKLDLGVARTTPILDILYLDHKHINVRDHVVVVVHENGKAEFWKFQESKMSWNLLHMSDLCNSPRARVVSMCVTSDLLIWCEERPPSESSSALSSSSSSNNNNFTYCICKRAFEVEEGAVSLGAVKIGLHNNPRFTLVSSGDHVYLLPDKNGKSLPNSWTFLLSWSPRDDTFRVSSMYESTPFKKESASAKENDFKRLVTDCVGYLSAGELPEIYGFSPAACGGLLLLLSTGWVCLLQREGILRQVYKVADNCSVNCETHTSLCIYQNMLAITKEQSLYLIDLSCGREFGKILLKREGLLFMNKTEERTPHLLSEMGLFVVVNREPSFNMKLSGTAEDICPGNLLLEAVFEEACKYYQQRSLSSAQLTVDALKKGGRFQAPISLVSILQNYLNAGSICREVEVSQRDKAEGDARQDKLKCSLESELKALVSLEEMKASIVRGNVNEVEVVCESLVQQEVTRLLSSELDNEALLYLNDIFSIFPYKSWTAVQVALQLHYNGEGSLSSRAPPDVWKTVLCPSQTPRTPANFPYTNGEPKHKLSLNIDSFTNSIPKSAVSTAILPVFELLCLSVFNFQPQWLPRFLHLAQQQQTSAGLGLASSSWSYSGGRGGEGGESGVPLYKRALCVLSSLGPDRDQNQDLEVELLLVSGRPNAILQALRILMGKQQWERVAQVAQTFCKQGPLLNKDIFTTLLCEVAQHRNLDPYLDLLWALCPEDITVTTILNLVLKNIPSPNMTSSPSLSDSISSSPTPFSDSLQSQLTVGLLKPLLRKVLQRETKPTHYADILQSQTFPPPVPPRQPTESPRTLITSRTDSALGNMALFAENSELQVSTHTNIQGARMTLPANPV
ncbi:BLOC-2 complex member HPS6 [Genypterus blacodes]|uniref:BLOC-2 complex member HPS6 n=1 Tax=Genypterus blacodes TaxID=154954 RepID=UPI003F75F46A